MNPRNQSFVVTLLLIIAAVAMVVMAVQRESSTKQALTINEVARDIKAGKVARVVIEDNNTLRIIYTDGDMDGVEFIRKPIRPWWRNWLHWVLHRNSFPLIRSQLK